MLLPELLGGQEVLHDQGQLGVDHVLAHAVIEVVLPGLGQGGVKLPGPGPEVLDVREAEVDHAEVRPVHAADLVHELLENVVGLGPGGPQLLQNRKPLLFAPVVAGRCGIGPVSRVN